MCKKLLPSVLLLGCLILVPLNANAAFTCDGATVAGAFSGNLAGTDSGVPFSSFLFLTVLSNGTFELTAISGEPGAPWQQLQAPGIWTPFFTEQGFCIILVTIPGGPTFLANVADSANSIQLSSPNNPNMQAAGMLQRSGI